MCKIGVLMICLVVSAFSGCGEPPTSTQVTNTQDPLPVIIRLETKSENITAMAGFDVPVYTVRTKDGRVLGQQLSEQQLQVRLPHIHRLLQRSFAEDGETGVIWAGMLDDEL